MFLPNTYSFVLTRGTIVDPSFTPETRRGVFLPNTDSFLLRRPVRSSRAAVLRLPAGRQGLATLSRARLLTGFTPEARRGVFLPNTDSFLLRRRPIVDPIFAPEGFTPTPVLEETGVGEQPKVKDSGKRTFLKVASIAGASAIISQLSPKKASAFIMGSSPTTGVVGVKNAANTRINPATQETVSTLATEATAATLLKTSDLTFDTGSLQVKVTSLPPSSFSDSGSVAKSGLVDVDRHVQVDVLTSALPTTASTETTLQTIAFGGTKFALRLATVGNVDYLGEAAVGSATSATVWRIKKIDSTSGIVITWADGNGSFDNTWDGYAGHTYS